MKPNDFKTRARRFLGTRESSEPQPAYDMRVRFFANELERAWDEGYADGKSSGYRQAGYDREAYEKGWDI